VQVHIFVWKVRQLERLARAARGESTEPLGNAEIDEINAAEYDKHAAWRWDQVAAAAEEAGSDLAASVRTNGPRRTPISGRCGMNCGSSRLSRCRAGSAWS